MKITVAMMIFNEERWIDLCLSKLIGYADHVVVAEGAIEFFWPFSNDGKSNDRTIGILNEWRNNRPDWIKLAGGKWQDKHEMSRALVARVPAETNYFHIVDADEIYGRSDLKFIKEYLIRKRPDVVRLRMRHWSRGGILLDKGIFAAGIHRIFRYERDMAMTEGNINVYQSASRPYKDVHTLPGEKCDHYGHIDPIRGEIKRQFYKWRAEQWQKDKNLSQS